MLTTSAVQGATPLFFLDYLATGALDPAIIETVVQGISDACRAKRFALSSEAKTAQMPGFYSDGEYDLAGTIIGAVNRGQDHHRSHDRGGRRLDRPSLERPPHQWLLSRPQASFSRRPSTAPSSMLTSSRTRPVPRSCGPTASYLSIIKKLCSAEVVSGMAHITGGGITENLLPRVPS